MKNLVICSVETVDSSRPPVTSNEQALMRETRFLASVSSSGKRTRRPARHDQCLFILNGASSQRRGLLRMTIPSSGRWHCSPPGGDLQAVTSREQPRWIELLPCETMRINSLLVLHSQPSPWPNSTKNRGLHSSCLPWGNWSSSVRWSGSWSEYSSC